MSKYFYVCERCGAALDPGERCECLRAEKTEKPQKIRYINKTEIKRLKIHERD